MAAILEGVEGALDEQEGTHGHQPQRKAQQGTRDEHGLMDADRGEEGPGDWHGYGQHDRTEEEHHQSDVAQGPAEFLPGVINPPIRHRLGQAGEDGRADGDGYQGVGQDEEGVGVLIGPVAGYIEGVSLQGGAVGDSGIDHVGQLVDDDHPQAPGRHRPHGAQAHTPKTPSGPIPEATLHQGEEEDHGLEGHPQAPGTGGQRDLAVVPEGDRLPLRIAEEFDEGHEAQATDQIGTDRAPGVGREAALGCQDLPQDRIEAVEEDLGHAPEGKGVRQGPLCRVPLGVQINRGQGRRRQHQNQGKPGQEDHGDRNQLVEAVGGVLFLQCPDDLRYQNGVENASGNQCEHDLGNHRPGLVGVGCDAGGPDGRGQEDGANLPGDPGGRST